MSSFSLEKFERWCKLLRIDTKEFGPRPLTWLGTQRYLITEIAAGLQAGIHTFIVLKGRQIGISTLMLALDLYWMIKHAGLQGAVITDSDENRELFRSYIKQYAASLPPQATIPVTDHNRTQLILENNSRLVYMVAGLRKKGELGRAKAVNFAHGTECSSWVDEEGFLSLLNTLAQMNPDRLYIFESTARGFNMFFETWRVAKESKTQRAIFVGWWRNELYRKERDHVDFKTYWDGQLTSDERIWVREVFERYRYNIAAEQLAWWRWYVDEQMKGDELLALQEMPPTEDYAFQLSGSKFFSGERVNMQYQFAVKQPCAYLRYKFGLNFEDTEVIETTRDMADVTIWEWPQENGIYVQGADPAYGSSEWADEFAACGLRCYGNRVVQVYEVGATEWTEAQFAWVIMHLAGSYKGTMIALELMGPGSTVFNEMQNVRQRVGARMGGITSDMSDVIGNIRDYLWRRPDSLSGNFTYQWQTNTKEKMRMMSTLRSYFERDMVTIKSPRCLEQFRHIHRQGDSIGGEGRAKDDRVIALGIATIAWNDFLLNQLLAENKTFELENRPKEEKPEVSQVQKQVLSFLTSQGITLVDPSKPRH